MTAGLREVKLRISGRRERVNEISLAGLLHSGGVLLSREDQWV